MNKAVLVGLLILVVVAIGAIGGYLYLTRTQKSQMSTETPRLFPSLITPTPTFANPFATPTYQNPFGETGDQEYKNPFESLR